MTEYINRDQKCASEVAKMAQLGRFDREFLFYGSAVQEANGKIYYYVTSNETALRRRIMQAREEERYFLPIIRQRHRTPVPSGMNDTLVQQFKWRLMRRMQRAYEPLLPKLAPFFHSTANDQALSLLRDYKEAIDGYFDPMQLQCFFGLVHMAFDAKILSRATYLDFKRWTQTVRREMRDDPVPSGAIERQFYGFVYEKDGTLYAISDARENSIVHKQIATRMQGLLTGPILSQYYAFEQSFEIGCARKAFEQRLRWYEDEAFMGKVRFLQTRPGVIDMEKLDLLAADVADNEDAAFAVAYFRNLWQPLNG